MGEPLVLSALPDEVTLPAPPHVIALRQMIGACMAHATQSQRLMLMPSREAKTNGIVARQAVILQALALLLDDKLAACGQDRVIEWRAVPANGAGVVETAT